MVEDPEKTHGSNGTAAFSVAQMKPRRNEENAVCLRKEQRKPPRRLSVAIVQPIRLGTPELPLKVRH